MDTERFANFVTHHDEETNGNGIVSLVYKDDGAGRPPLRLVFDRGEGSGAELGKRQARRFIVWLREHGIKPAY